MAKFYEVTATASYTFYVEADSFDEAEELANEAIGDEALCTELEGAQIGSLEFSTDVQEDVNPDEVYVVYLNPDTGSADIR